MELLSFKEFVLESVSDSNIDKLGETIRKYLQKKLGIPVLKYPGVEEFSNNLIKKGVGIRYYYGKKSVRFNFIGTKINSKKLHSVSIWNGTTQAPNFNIDLPDVSLVKVLPDLIDQIRKPTLGKIEIIPDQKTNLTESFELDLLIESKAAKFLPAYDEAFAQLKSNERFFVEPGNWRAYAIYSAITKTYPELFDKQGRNFILVGDKNKIDRELIIKSVGGIETEVTKGPTKETYQVQGVEEPEERVTFKEQLAHLKSLTKLLINGASNSLIISGAGGVGKCVSINSNLTIYETRNDQIKLDN
jgi:hypothetical protein